MRYADRVQQHECPRFQAVQGLGWQSPSSIRSLGLVGWCSMSSSSEKHNNKKERNRRRRSIRQIRKEKVKHVHVVAKDLEDTKKELAVTRTKLMQARGRALQLSKDVFKPPKRPTISTAL